MRLDEALALFEVQMRADGRSVHTRGQYRRTIALLSRWLAAEGRADDIAALTPEVLAQFLVSREVRELADGRAKRTVTVNGTRTSLRVFFRYAHDAGYLLSNPARLVRRAICQPPPPKALSDAEVERLEAALVLERGPVARRDHLLIALMLATGIRLGSALALDVEDVDLANGEIWLRHVKGDRTERVFLGRDIKDHLVGFLARKPKRGPLFRGPRGERLTQRCAQKRITIWFSLVGVQRGSSGHSLRHSFAMKLYRKTSDILLVRQALGHRSIVSTLVYANCDDARLREALMA